MLGRIEKTAWVLGVVALATTACGRSKHEHGPGGADGSSGASAQGGAPARAGTGGRTTGASGAGARTSGGGAAGSSGGAGAGGRAESGAGGESGTPEEAGIGGDAGGGNELGGAGGSSDSEGTLEVTDVPSFERAETAALCRFIFNCPDPTGDGPLLRLVLQSEARCLEVLSGSPIQAPAHADLAAKVQAGSIGLNLQSVEACLDGIARCEPETLKRMDSPACRAVFQGSSPLGGACSRAEDCADDARCVIDAACPGTCTARPRHSSAR
jgi:hypothetical protein